MLRDSKVHEVKQASEVSHQRGIKILLALGATAFALMGRSEMASDMPAGVTAEVLAGGLAAGALVATKREGDLLTAGHAKNNQPNGIPTVQNPEAPQLDSIDQELIAMTEDYRQDQALTQDLIDNPIV